MQVQMQAVGRFDAYLLTPLWICLGSSLPMSFIKLSLMPNRKVCITSVCANGVIVDICSSVIATFSIVVYLIILFAIGRSAKVAENGHIRKQRELDALTARDRELDMLFERLYEDNVAGKIDDARFAKMSKRYEQEQGENAKKIKALRLELKKDESKRMDIDDFLETVRRYTDATTITKRMVAELIDHIEVYHAEKQDGVTNQRVVIYYNCIGAFDVPDRRKIPETDIIMETRKGVALSYAPEQVAV